VSLRKQGHKTTGANFAKANNPVILLMGHGVWVPAFAGTTR